MEEGLRSALTQVSEKSLPLEPLSQGKSQVSLETKDIAAAQAQVESAAADLKVMAVVTESTPERKVILIHFQPGQAEALTGKLRDSGGIVVKSQEIAPETGLTEVVLTAAP